MKKISFFDVFNVFLKIGIILLGGGYVIIPVMKSELIEKRNWLNEDELCDYYCVSQCLPGIIAANMSILVGYKMAKIKGALAAILGMSFSPFISIVIIAHLLNKILAIPFIESLFWGVNLSVIVLIYLALKEMWSKSIVDIFSAFWFIFILFLALIKVNPAFLIIGSIVLGIIFQIIKERKDKNA